MSLTDWIIPDVRTILICGAAGVCIGASSAWYVQGLRMNSKVSSLQATRSDEISEQYKQAADDLVAGAKKVKESADGANVDISALNKSLNDLKKASKNANPKPLPDDCRLDADRLSGITEAAATANAAVAGLRLSPGLQADKRP
jgi:uncharacterized protein HemX